jgi:PASTA domain
VATFFIALSLLLSACAEEVQPEPAAEPPSPEETTDFAEIESPEPAPEPETVQVPDVVGKQFSAARRIVKRADLQLNKRRKPSGRPEGTVIKQTPSAGAERAPDSFVRVVVAKPKPPPPPMDCQGYSPCIPPGPDVDCAGGTGDGPRYVSGPVTITGSDPYGLDGDGDGVGCE